LKSAVEIARNDIESLKLKSQSKIDKLENNFKQMRSQVLSVLKDAEIKLKTLENEKLESDIAHKDLMNEYDRVKDLNAELGKQHESQLKVQRKNITSELEISHDEKIAAMRALYEEKLKQVENLKDSQVNELTVQVNALKQQVQIKKNEVPKGWSLEAADFINKVRILKINKYT
jgi:outer membrane murein-binding lipoprotein Lpp